MSIGKKLLALRQSKGLSQEELGNILHVSRQTISKYESDLSLPDMKIMLEISKYFQVSITELLGLDEDVEDDSIKKIYEQTSLVLENLQKENKRRIIRDWIIIAVCLVILCLSVMILIKENKKTVKTVYYSEPYSSNYYDDNKINYGESSYQVALYDFDNMMVTTDYRCVLNKYTNDTQIDLVLTSANQNEEFVYPMVKENDYTFVLKETIPFIDYKSVQITIKQANESELIKINNSLNDDSDYLYFSNIVKKLVKVYIPCDDGTLIRNKIVYEPDYERLKNEGYNITGKLNGDLTIKMTEFINSTSAEKKMIDETISLANKKTFILDDEISKHNNLGYTIECSVQGNEFEIIASNKKVNTSFGIYYSEYIIYSYEDEDY